MAVIARAITIEFLGNARDLNNAIDSSESRMKRFGGVMGKVGKAAALGLAGGVVVAGAGLAKLTQGAIEDEAAQKKLATALKNTTGANDAQIASVEDWISKQGTALGVTDDELRPAFEKLAQATGSVDEAQRQMAIAMDVAAGRGVSLETVTKAMEKANNGNVGALAKLGIETKKANGETISLEEANKRLAGTFKGQAEKAANTTAGKMQRLKVILAEAGETIGAKLIPIVTKMADWFLNKGLPAIQAFGAYLQQKLPPIFEVIKTKVIDTFNKIKGPATEAFQTIKGIVQDAVTIIQALWKRFGKNIIEFTRGSFKAIANVIRGVFNVIKGIFKVVSSVLKGDWKGAWDGIKSIVKGAGQVLKGMVQALLNTIKFAFKNVWAAIKGIVGNAWDGIKNLVSNGFDGVINLVKGIPDKIKAVGKFYKDAGKALIGQFVEGIKNAGDFVSGIAGNIWDAVKGFLNAAIDKINSTLEFDIGFSVFGKSISKHIDPPDIPHLAKGGIVRKPTLALIGEDGPEAVVPLGAKNAPRGGIGMGGTTYIINIHNVTDSVGAAREIEKVLIKGQRGMSGPYQFVTRTV